jgi:hypothetical protein
MYSSTGTVNITNDINIPYGSCLLPSNVRNRQGAPGSETFGNGIDYAQCVPNMIKTPQELGPMNKNNVNTLDRSFFGNTERISGFSSNDPTEYSRTDLQSYRPIVPYSNYYIRLASESLHVKPDIVFSVFFSDENIDHLRLRVVEKIKEITMESGVAGPDGVTIKAPNMDDFFYYMVNIYQNYKIHNGSICFVNLANKTNVQSEISKLNSNVLQEYISKMISQINMYIYYYKDASQLPGQLSLPTYAAMKGSKVLEYNTGFQQGNSTGIASYNQVGNII